jgi:hypothetical protein
MRKLLALCAALTCVALACNQCPGQTYACPGGQCAAYAGAYTVPVTYHAGYAYSRPAYRQVYPTYRPAAQPTYQATAYAAPAYQASAGDSPAQFLAELNAARAALGRGPLSWDQNLANAAACARYCHDPAGMRGAQCWAGTQSYCHALALWKVSSAHWSILVNARRAVGMAVNAAGAHCNAD